MHILGDPIDTIWSLLDKLALARRTHIWIQNRINFEPAIRRAQRHLSVQNSASFIVTSSGNSVPADQLMQSDLKGIESTEPRPGVHREDLKHLEVICFALDDFDPRYRVTSKGIPGGVFARKLVNFIQDDRLSEEDREDILISCNHASTMLSQTRVKSARRSLLAVVAYAYPLFTSVASGDASASAPVHFPHTIALRELYYWLLPAITLSSAAGAFPTHWTSYAAR